MSGVVDWDALEWLESNADDANAAVVEWRFISVRMTGADPKHAEAIAVDTSVDLHDVLGLISQGCPALTAYDIVR